jgi:hypothetical protein
MSSKIILTKFKTFFILVCLILCISPTPSFTKELEPASPLEIFEDAKENDDPNTVVLKGSATRVIDKKQSLTVSLQTILSSEFSSVGDPVEAKVLVKPSKKGETALDSLRGSKLIGRVVDVTPSRKAGRSGRVRVEFYALKIKSGREVPVRAELTTESFKGQEATKLILYDAKLLTVGALWGAYGSLKWAPVAAIYSNGLSVAVSAGIGAGMGLIGALRRSGETKTFFPGQASQIQFKEGLNIDDDFLQEAKLSNKTINADLVGLNMKLLDTHLENSEEYDSVLAVKVKILNNTSSNIYPCDFLLIPKDGGDPVIADLRTSGFALLKRIPKGEESTLTLLYPVDKRYSASDYNLALVDPLDKAFLSKVDLGAEVTK